MPKKSYEHVTKATRYAKEITTGKRVACKWVKLACARFLNDLDRAAKKNPPFLFDPRKAERVCRFMEHLPHTKGRWAREFELVKLEPWQCFIFVNIYGFVNEHGLRRYTEAYLRVARKNGKSIKAAGIGLYALCEDGEYGAEVYSGATNRKQALEVFTPAKRMVEMHPDMKTLYDLEVNVSNLSIAEDNSKFEPIIGNPGDGSSPSCALIDEFHEHRTPDLYDTMVTGMAAREQPLTVIITTAGITTAGPCFEKDDDVKKILEGTFKDDSMFGIIYCADEKDDWDGITAMKKANPNLDVSVSKEYLKRQLTKAKRSPKDMAAYQTKHLNWWVGAGVTFLNVLKWKANAGKIDMEKMRGLDCIYGLDLSSRIDITAVVRVFYRRDEDEQMRYWVTGEFFIPENRVKEDKTKLYKTWVEQGHLKTHEEDEIDYIELRDFIKADAEIYEPHEVAYDPWKAAGIEQELTKEGFTMVRVPQTIAQFTSPMDELEAANEAGRLIHDDNPVMNWMISNLCAKVNPTNDTKKPHKEIAKNKIDGPVAMLMGINRALLRQPTARSPWEDPEYSMGE